MFSLICEWKKKIEIENSKYVRCNAMEICKCVVFILFCTLRRMSGTKLLNLIKRIIFIYRCIWSFLTYPWLREHMRTKKSTSRPILDKESHLLTRTAYSTRAAQLPMKSQKILKTRNPPASIKLLIRVVVVVLRRRKSLS